MKPLSARLAGLSLLTLFVFSGIAGLIYQSVWSQYLGLTLGHAAYAQTLVLSIFMGGMALGAWLVSLKTPSWTRLVRGYAAVEAAIGVLGLAFQGAFDAYTRFSQENVLPFLGGETLAHLYQWGTAAALVLPQSILLGATFPLLSAGYLRLSPHSDGEVLGGLYFTNSLGAAAGALLSTFCLLPAFGLPGTVMAAGWLNVAVGLGAWAIARWAGEGQTPSPGVAARPAAEAAAPDDARRVGRVMLWATAISGATSFVYEIAWVRMLNQALGSTIHSFELMLAAFILGLAFGGLWIRRRARRIADPARYAGYAQVFMGIAALLSAVAFAASFRWVGWLIAGLGKTDAGYTLFELGTAAVSLAVMFPAAFFAGMTLPLFTMALLRAGGDERAIGRIYAANTLGSIAGVLLVTHVLIPLMGVRMGLCLAALADAGLGFFLLRPRGGFRPARALAAACAGVLAAFALAMSLGEVSPAVQASGVFRTGVLMDPELVSVPFLKDGKTATVSISRDDRRNVFTLATNGKPDASLAPMGETPTEDEPTMVSLGLMPLIAAEEPGDIAVIGWGSGLTTHTLLGSRLPRVVDSIEIEPVMVEAAWLFGPRVARAYEDPRARLHIDDARTFFATGRRQYDVIVSEPSNPWVSGVANLFTVEFYRFLKRHLKENGVLVQWLHTYEIDDRLLATLLAALAEEFPRTRLYWLSDGDLLLLAPRTRLKQPFAAAPWREEALARELARVGLGAPDEIALREIGGRATLQAYIRLFGARPYSDYYPIVSLEAPRARFKKQSADTLYGLAESPLPVQDILECTPPPPAGAALGVNPANIRSVRRAEARRILAALGDPGKVWNLAPQNRNALALLGQTPPPGDPAARRAWSEALAILAANTLGLLPAEDLRPFWNAAPAWLPKAAAETEPARLLLRAYAATAARDPAGMAEAAQAALDTPESAQLADEARAQMLVVAMLGAIGKGDPQRATALGQAFAGPLSQRWGTLSAFLLAFADGGRPACSAAPEKTPPAGAP
ncbi:MAG: fused MFS/spermidine synthase [Candidatus Accumulibacter sp.]|jgi:predicted membrane-bound spermidine synthase|nr:fused MFS/spermidine synthase [Accumulibacter sp.]